MNGSRDEGRRFVPAKPAPPPFSLPGPARTNGRFEQHYNEGIHHLERHRLAPAIAAFEAALAANPPPHRQAAVLFALATAARRMGQARTAEDFYHRVLMIEPGRREAVVNLSNLYREGGKLQDAQSMLATALDADPGAPELWLSLGHVMRAGGDVDRARTFFAEAVRLKPGYAQALGSLADLLVDFGETAAALDHYDAALRKDPHNAQLHLHRGLVLLSEGRTSEGWRDYAWRFKAAGKPLRYTHNLKAWDGRPLGERSLLIAAEQGLGDQLIFASLLGAAIERAKAKAVFIECEKRLVPLFQRSFPDAHVHEMVLREDADAHTIDYAWLTREGGARAATAIGSLPALLGIPDGDSGDAPMAYLRPDPAQWRLFKEMLAAAGPPPYTGIAWRSGKMTGQRALQFAPLADWTAFAKDLEGTLVSLQYDASAEELDAFSSARGRPIFHPAFDQKNEIDRMAALTAALDLVVTAPVAVSAISSAVGTTTLKILFDRSWTALGTSYEPLAPACRHIRPDRPGNWADVFARAAARCRDILDSD